MELGEYRQGEAEPNRIIGQGKVVWQPLFEPLDGAEGGINWGMDFAFARGTEFPEQVNPREKGRTDRRGALLTFFARCLLLVVYIALWDICQT